MNTTQGKAVIFDLGRVLVKYDHAATMAGIAELATKEISRMERLTSGDVGRALGTGEMNARQLHSLLCQRAGIRAPFATFVEAYAAGLARNHTALAYAASLQQREGISVGIISNTNEAHSLWLHENVPELKKFHTVLLSSEVGMLKPDAEIFQHALDKLGISAAQAIFIDDLAENVVAAQALGMAAIVHTDWAETRPQIEEWINR